VIQNILPTAATYILVDRLSRPTVNPTDMERTVLEAAVEVVDVTHHPCHFDAALDGELPHGPTSA
jgi:hypothetical protein